MRYNVNLPTNCISNQPYLGLKKEVKDWLNENIGERDKNWDFPNRETLGFLKKMDAINFALTWT